MKISQRINQLSDMLIENRGKLNGNLCFCINKEKILLCELRNRPNPTTLLMAFNDSCLFEGLSQKEWTFLEQQLRKLFTDER